MYIKCKYTYVNVEREGSPINPVTLGVGTTNPHSLHKLPLFGVCIFGWICVEQYRLIRWENFNFLDMYFTLPFYKNF